MARYYGLVQRGPDRRWLLHFPDVPDIVVAAATLTELRQRARRSLREALDERRGREPLPVPSDVEKVVLHPFAASAMLLAVPYASGSGTAAPGARESAHG